MIFWGIFGAKFPENASKLKKLCSTECDNRLILTIFGHESTCSPSKPPHARRRRAEIFLKALTLILTLNILYFWLMFTVISPLHMLNGTNGSSNITFPRKRTRKWWCKPEIHAVFVNTMTQSNTLFLALFLRWCVVHLFVTIFWFGSFCVYVMSQASWCLIPHHHACPISACSIHTAPPWQCDVHG